MSRRGRTDDLPAPPSLERPTWTQHAACRGMDTEIFFPTVGQTTLHAKAICNTCAVTARCLDYALQLGERFGVWGGLSERQRRRLRKSRAPRPRRDQSTPATIALDDRPELDDGPGVVGTGPPRDVTAPTRRLR